MMQHPSLWRTCRSGPTVRDPTLNFSHSEVTEMRFALPVNASELERLKKRFMKLDRYVKSIVLSLTVID